MEAWKIEEIKGKKQRIKLRYVASTIIFVNNASTTRNQGWTWKINM